jgi:uncharacterized protein (DUF697 family)
MDTFFDWLQWIFLLGCVLPIVVMIIAAVLIYYFGKRWVEDFIEPDIPKLNAKLEAMRQEQPDIKGEKLIGKVVHQQALKCGIVGAVTGFGGFVTLPLSLPLDMLLTARYQATMVSFIAQVYGFHDSVENKAATYAVMTGSTEVSKVTTKVIQKYAPQFIGKSFSKLIPILGAVIAFAVNYFLARSMASLAVRWYSKKSREEIIAQVT